MKRRRLVWLIGCVVLSGTAVPSHGGQGSDPKITFKHPSDAPAPRARDLSRDDLYLPGGGAGEHGSFANVVAHRISAVTVTWFDQNRFKSEAQAEELLRQLLNSENTVTFGFHAWSYGYDSLGIVATVEHVSGQRGRWIVWCPPINLTWTYQDGDGIWWWGAWESHKAPVPTSAGAAPK